MDNADILDVVLRQIEDSTRSKILVRNVIDKVKENIVDNISVKSELTPADLLNS